MEEDDRISEHSIRLVVQKRRPAEAQGLVSDDADAATRAEALLARLDQTSDPAARARLLIEIAITLRDGLSDRSQAVDALL